MKYYIKLTQKADKTETAESIRKLYEVPEDKFHQIEAIIAGIPEKPPRRTIFYPS